MNKFYNWKLKKHNFNIKYFNMLNDKEKNIQDFLNKIKNNSITNEEELKIAFIILMYGFDITIDKAERKTTNGRVDCLYGKSIIEFKRPGTLKSLKKAENAVIQVQKYETEYYSYSYVFDGEFFIDNYNGHKFEVSLTTMQLLIKSLGISANMDKISLNKDSVDSKLSLKNKEVKLLVMDMYYEIEKQQLNNDEFLAWKKLFSITIPHGTEKSYLLSKKMTEISEIFGENINFDIALFVLHTYYSIVVKNVVISNLLQNKILEIDLNDLNNFETLENGIFFERIGIFNMFNNDMFSWYAKSSTRLTANILKFRQTIFNFETTPLKSLSEDIFNLIYESIVPHSVRKSLGEYYTPPSVAKEIMQFGNVDYKKKIVDPACGTGTFLNVVIEEKIKLNMTVEEILTSIMGADINPVAIIAARANILIRVVFLDSFEKSKNYFIPVFNVDSTEIIQKNVFLHNTEIVDFFSTNQEYKISCSVYQFLEKNDQYTIEKQIEHATLTGLSTKVISVLQQLNKVLHNKKGAERLSIKQNFYAALQSKFDYIVGNPPWVKWQHLPSTYREKLKNEGHDVLFSPYRNSGGNSLDLFAPILMAASINYLEKNGEIIMIMPMSLNFNASFHNVRKFNFLNGQKIKKIMDFDSKNNVFKDVDINFGYYVISNEQSLEYVKIDSRGRAITKFPIINPYTNAIIPFDSKEDFDSVQPYLGLRSKGISVRSGVQFSPNYYRQFIIVSKSDGILKLKSADIRKVQKIGIEKIDICAEEGAIKPIIRSTDLRSGMNCKIYSWWLYEKGSKEPFPFEKVRDKFPVLADNLTRIVDKLDPKNSSDFNKRISKSTWYSNTRVGKYTQAPYRICFSDNGNFDPVLVTDTDLIPEGHVRFIPYYDEHSAKKAFEILSKPSVKKLMNTQFLNLNKSFLPEYMWIKF